VSDDTPLGRLFNEVFSALGMPRTISAPDTTTVDGWNNSEKALLFYEMCLIEKYLHSIMDNLVKWKHLTKKYANEFEYSWKFFALANRIDLINEFGGDENDYNEFGSVRTDFSDTELEDYTIVAELADVHTNSIFHSTNPMNCLTSCFMIEHSGANNIIDFFKKTTGKPIKTYRKDDDGELIENDWADEAMLKAHKELIHENIAALLWSVLIFVRALVNYVEKLPKTEDNKGFFVMLPTLIDKIFNLNVPLIELPKIDDVEND